MGLDANVLSVNLEQSKCAWMLALRLGDDDSARQNFQKFYECIFQAYENCIQQLDRVQREIKNLQGISLIEDFVGFRYELRRLAEQYGSCLQKLADFDGVNFFKVF